VSRRATLLNDVELARVPVRVLELGSYVAPAYAGMILAEQGCDVVKWTNPGAPDPILGLVQGDELWEWINHRKTLAATNVIELFDPDFWGEREDNGDWWPDIVLDNFRPEALARRGIDPAALAERHHLVWVSLRSETPELHDGRSFDVIAQARSWMQYGDWLPFYVGDTAAGLWMAFKALAMLAADRPGHYPIGQASCLQKLVEGELQIDVERDRHSIPWDKEAYGAGPWGAYVEYRDRPYREPVRDTTWKLAKLWHDGGRIRI
jgi:crotonobetainyl-CoA:carnitine CoA-transferase CaiB-like acyl-CoA transferase